MTGEVTSLREAVVRISVGHQGQDKTDILAVVDTGFTDHLTLPTKLVEDLNPPYRLEARAQLADGSFVGVRAHDAWIYWHGRERPIIVFAIDGDPLLGMAMIYGSRLQIEAVDGGAVLIEPIE